MKSFNSLCEEASSADEIIACDANGSWLLVANVSLS
jgi:hypothetical protein